MTSIAKLKRRTAFHLKDIAELGLSYQFRHLHRRDSEDFNVHVRGVGNLKMRPNTADPAAVSQVFSLRQYDLSSFPQHDRIMQAYREIIERGSRPLIVDLGANNGASARWFTREYPEAKIVAVEPDPDNARICKVNAAGYPVEVVQAAVGGSPGHVVLDSGSPVGERETYVTTCSYTATRTASGGVPVVTVGQIVADHPGHELFIVKIDIEGFEDDLFSSGTEWVQSAHVIYLEPHDWKFPNRKTSRSFQETMGPLPFQVLLSGENIVYVRHS